MVTFAEQLCTSPREFQAFEPFVQLLVQDTSFCEAVRDARLHSAAIAAVRLLKGSDIRRPIEKKAVFSEADGLEGSTPRHAVATTSPVPTAAVRAPVDPRLRQLMHSMRQEALHLEDLIPWNSVRRTWRNKRSNWRRQIKQGELVADMAMRLKELRTALLIDDPQSFVGCGHAWRVQLEACLTGRGSHHSLVSVWEELKSSIKAWLGIYDEPAYIKPAQQQHSASPQLQATVVRAVQTMQAVAACDGDMLQVSLEGILNHSREGLMALQQTIDCEHRSLVAQEQQDEGGKPLSVDTASLKGACASIDAQEQACVSYFSAIEACWEDSAFDSGAESDCGSDATDMDSDFD